MNILLLAGTGAIGGNLAKLLYGTDNQCYITSRQRKSNVGNLHYLKGNAYEDDFLFNVLELKKWDVIIDFVSYSESRFKRVFEKLLSATEQYIFLSSARVYADSAIVRESSPRLLDVCDDKAYVQSKTYAIAKALEENVLLKSHYSNYTIVRPYLTYDCNRLQLGALEKEAWLYRALNNKKIVVPSEVLDAYTTLTNGYDVANTISALIGKKEMRGEIVTITSGEAIKWRDVLSIYLDTIENVVGSRPNYVECNIKDIGYHQSMQWLLLYDRIYNRIFENSKLLNITPGIEFIPAKQGLRKELTIFLSNINYKKINWKLEAIHDKVSNEFSTPIEILKNGSLKDCCNYYTIRLGLKNINI